MGGEVIHACPYRAVGCAQYLRSNGAIEEPVQNRHAPGRHDNQIHILASCRVENHGSRRTLTNEKSGLGGILRTRDHVPNFSRGVAERPAILEGVNKNEFGIELPCQRGGVPGSPD
jgi:hypothetical protein